MEKILMKLNQEVLELAKEYESITISKKVAVENFGSEDCKTHFTKYNKFKSKSLEEALIKTLNQLYKSVEVVKIGRAYQYKLGAARVEIAERHREIGKNATNGKWNKSTKHLDALILAHLEHNLINGKEIQKSFINWLFEFKMINEKQHELYQSKFDNQSRKDIDNLIRENVENSDERIVSNSYRFFLDDIQAQRNTMLNSLKRMEEEGIVETFKRHKAYLNKPIQNTKGVEVKVISIDAKTYQMYVDAKRRLKQEYNLSEKDITYRTFNPSQETIDNIKKYKKDLKEFLSDIDIKDSYGTKMKVSISNIWEELAIVVKATRTKTMDYLHKYHSEILVEYQIHKYEQFLSHRAVNYRENRTEERLEKASNRRKKHINDAEVKDELHNESLAFGNEADFYLNEALRMKEEFIKAIEKLDEIFGDDFIIDENKIEAALKMGK